MFPVTVEASGLAVVTEVGRVLVRRKTGATCSTAHELGSVGTYKASMFEAEAVLTLLAVRAWWVKPEDRGTEDGMSRESRSFDSYEERCCLA